MADTLAVGAKCLYHEHAYGRDLVARVVKVHFDEIPPYYTITIEGREGERETVRTRLIHLHDACRDGDTERVRRLLDEGAAIDEKDEYGGTALMHASRECHTAVVQLLLVYASGEGHTEVVRLLLGKGAAVDERDKDGSTALMKASLNGRTEVVQLLLDKGAAVDEKDRDGGTALMWAGWNGHTVLVQLLLDEGASVDVQDKEGHTALPAVVTLDEDQLGCMAASVVHCQLLKGQGQGSDAALDATATAVLQLVRLAGFARERALELSSSDPRSADDHQALFGRLQLAAAACVQNGESGMARDEKVGYGEEKETHKLFRSDNGRKALEHAVQIEAKELLAQRVVQDYVQLAWRGNLANLGWAWVLVLLVLLPQLLFLLPLVALVPNLDPWLFKKLGGLYLLGLPLVKFGLECAADLALALALTLIPATDLATAPIAPLLLVWVGSGLLSEAREVMSFSSSDAKSRLDRMYDRLVAYWGGEDGMNRLDAPALIFSFAAIVAAVSANSRSDESTATSLRTAAVFLLWFRLIRVLLVMPLFIPYVLMFFRMIFGDLARFLVLLCFLLLAFAASWTVLFEPEPLLGGGPSHVAIIGCADELGDIDVFSTLQRLLEGALTGNDFFECARDSTESPIATWALSFVFAMLTAVLLLNMVIAMCAAAAQTAVWMAKTFDNISETSATSYLFLFAQRTLTLQDEPPTPPPLNVLGLPCHMVCLLWKWVQNHQKVKRAEAVVSRQWIRIDSDASGEGEGEGGEGEGGRPGEHEGAGGKIEEAARVKKATDKAHSPDRDEPLAKKITEYILDSQDKADQEERWRTTMKRETMKRFCEQRAHVQDVETKIQASQLKMDEKIQALQLKMDEMMDQLIKLVNRQD